MGFCSCHSVLKFLLILFNIVFGVFGLAGCVFSIWMLVDPTYILTQESTDYIVSIVIILIASILLVIISFLGICGTIRQSQCLMLTFFSILLIICVAEIAAALWGYINRDTLEEQIRNSVKITVEQEYSQDNEARRVLFDTFQAKLHCCGAERPADWEANKPLSLTVTGKPNYYKIPESCCREGTSMNDCKTATVIPRINGVINYDVIYDKGCYTLIIQTIKSHACLLIGIAIGLITVQVLALIISLILAYIFNKSRRYKA